jgi:hypothetical protein
MTLQQGARYRTAIRMIAVLLVALLLLQLLLPRRAHASLIVQAITSTNYSNASQISIATPSPIAAGDVLLGQITFSGGSSTSITAPSGWTLIDRQDNGTAVSQAIYYKVATSSEPASYTWTLSAAGRFAGGITAFRGADIANPIDAYGGQVNTSSTTVSAPAVTTRYANDMIVMLAGYNGSEKSFTGPSGFTQSYLQNTNAGQNGTTAYTASNLQSAIGSTGTLTAVAGDNKAQLNIGHTIALKASTLDHFTVTLAPNGSPISTQTAGAAFNILITAVDANGNLVTGWSGTVDLTSTGNLIAGGGTTAAFSNGQLTQSVNISNTGNFTISVQRTLGTETGTSNPFAVVAGPPLKLLVLAPGESAAPGSSPAGTGKTGTPSAQMTGIAFPVTVSVVDNYWNTVTTNNDAIAFSTAQDPQAVFPSGIQVTNGTGTFNVTLNNSGTITVNASDTSESAVVGPGSTAVPVNSPSGNLFNAYEPSTPSGAIAGVIKTHVAGSAFSLNIIAIKNGAVDTSYNKPVQIQLLDSHDNSGTLDPTTRCRSTWTPIPGTSISQGAWSSGVLPVTFTELNAWQDTRVQVTSLQGTTQVGCSNDNFAIRPASLSFSVTDNDRQTAGTVRVLNNLNWGGVVHNAGQYFTITATAYNAQSTPAVTSNYAGAPTGLISSCPAGAAGPACTSSFGTLGFSDSNGGWLPGSGSTPTGTVVTNNATYSEVGSFALQLQDTTFANVDSSDSSLAERTIPSSPASSPAWVNVGRFVPDHFALTLASPAIRNQADFTCTVPSIFTYMGEPLDLLFTLTAQNAANVTTLNYDGTWAQLPIQQTTLSGAGSFNIDAIDANGTPTPLGSRLALQMPTGNWSKGVTQGPVDAVTGLPGPLQVPAIINRAAAPDGPYGNVKLGIAPQDADGVTLATTALNLDTNQDGTPEHALVGYTQIRYGRMRLVNAYGSELLPLPVGLRNEYFVQNGYVTNADDSCTQAGVPVSGAAAGQSALVFGAASSSNHLQAGQTTATMNGQAGTGTFVHGDGKLWLSAPGAAHDGYVDILMATPAYLQYNWGAGLAGPQARARFGIYKSAGPVIYMRELY